MEIRLFNFVKRENSTSRPSGEGRKFNCKLKSETSVINTEILIDFADQAPEIVEGRTLVPLRAIFEALGASVEWDQATKTVTSSMDDVTIKLTIGDNTLYRNGEGVTLDVAAQILNGRTMVPARAIAEAYGVDVQWMPLQEL